MTSKTKKKTGQRDNPQDQRSELSKRIEAFRLQRELTYAALATLIGSISLETVRRACLGFPLTIRIASKIENFLGNMNGADRAA